MKHARITYFFGLPSGSSVVFGFVDHGVMSVAVPPQNLERVLALLGEVTTAPRFGEIEVERGIVREEILEDLDDDGRDVDADNISRALIYDTHPLGFTITNDDMNASSITGRRPSEIGTKGSSERRVS